MYCPMQGGSLGESVGYIDGRLPSEQDTVCIKKYGDLAMGSVLGFR